MVLGSWWEIDDHRPPPLSDPSAACTTSHSACRPQCCPMRCPWCSVDSCYWRSRRACRSCSPMCSKRWPPSEWPAPAPPRPPCTPAPPPASTCSHPRPPLPTTPHCHRHPPLPSLQRSGQGAAPGGELRGAGGRAAGAAGRAVRAPRGVEQGGAGAGRHRPRLGHAPAGRRWVGSRGGSRGGRGRGG